MKERKYHTDQMVTMTPGRARAMAKGRCEVMRLLPVAYGNYQYRIRSVMDGHERVAAENELDQAETGVCNKAVASAARLFEGSAQFHRLARLDRYPSI